MTDREKKPASSQPAPSAVASSDLPNASGLFLGFEYRMTPWEKTGTGVAGPSDTYCRTARRISVVLFVVSWGLLLESLFLPAICLTSGGPVNSGLEVLVATFTCCWHPLAFPYAACNAALITSPIACFRSISQQDGWSYAMFLALGVVVLVPFAYLRYQVGPGFILWSLSLMFATAAFFLPPFYRLFVRED